MMLIEKIARPVQAATPGAKTFGALVIALAVLRPKSYATSDCKLREIGLSRSPFPCRFYIVHSTLIYILKTESYRFSRLRFHKRTSMSRISTSSFPVIDSCSPNLRAAGRNAATRWLLESGIWPCSNNCQLQLLLYTTLHTT